MNRVATRALALLWLCIAIMPLQLSASTSNEWRFEVFLDDKPIGFHNFHLSTSGDTRKLRGEARFSVKLLGFTVYDYIHENLELWQHDCLQQIEASTDDNGKELFVRGSRNGEQLLLESHAGSSGMYGCVMSFAYWNPQILSQQQLLNPQTGEYLEVHVEPLGEKTLQLQGREVPSLHYRLRTEENEIELWYSTNRDWLALSSTTSGGRQLHYRRVAIADDTGGVASE
jgi:hypothetical protein